MATRAREALYLLGLTRMLTSFYVILLRFEQYPEDNAATQYGETIPDPYGDRFPDFEYASS